MEITAAGGALGIPGLYVTGDPGGIGKAVNAKAVGLDDAPRGYAEFDAGAATKFVLNPNGYVKA